MPKKEKKEEETHEESTITDKLSEKLSSINAEEKLDNLYEYSRTHVGDTISYVVLFVGIILALFQVPYGVGLVGVIFGIYFSSEITDFVKGASNFVEEQGVFRSFILGGVGIGLFIGSPLFFIGTAAAVGIKTLVLGLEKDKKGKKSKKEKE